MRAELALKIDVDTYRGTREGVPRLVELLQLHGAGATFLFSLGPDHTGPRDAARFQAGLLRQGETDLGAASTTACARCSTARCCPGPTSAGAAPTRCARCSAAGFEVGIHCWDHVRWQDNVARKDADWTEREMQQAF